MGPIKSGMDALGRIGQSAALSAGNKIRELKKGIEEFSFSSRPKAQDQIEKGKLNDDIIIELKDSKFVATENKRVLPQASNPTARSEVDQTIKYMEQKSTEMTDKANQLLEVYKKLPKEGIARKNAPSELLKLLKIVPPESIKNGDSDNIKKYKEAKINEHLNIVITHKDILSHSSDVIGLYKSEMLKAVCSSVINVSESLLNDILDGNSEKIEKEFEKLAKSADKYDSKCAETRDFLVQKMTGQNVKLTANESVESYKNYYINMLLNQVCDKNNPRKGEIASNEKALDCFQKLYEMSGKEMGPAKDFLCSQRPELREKYQVTVLDVNKGDENRDVEQDMQRYDQFTHDREKAIFDEMDFKDWGFGYENEEHKGQEI